MGTSGSAPDVSREATRGVFSQLEEPHSPLTTTEVADRLDCPQRAAHRQLDGLVERGELRTREIEQGIELWWRPDDGDAFDGKRSELAELGAFVNAVEDYAIFTLDPDGTVASWNEGAARIKGYSADEIVGEHFSTFYTDEDVDDGVPGENLEIAAEQGRAEDSGWRVREDGSRFWADVVITAIRDDDGTLQGFTKVTRDMTERREYEQELRRERDFIEQVLETVPVSICTIGPDGEFIRANERTLDRLGLEESELGESNINAWDLFDADGDPVPADERPWERVLETGSPVLGYQCQVDLPDAGRRWVSINAAPLTDRQQDGRIVVSVDDVTDQKERERELQRERDQTEKLLRTAPVAIAVQNADGETLIANERAQEDFGIPEREFLDDPIDTGEWEIYDDEGEPIDPDERVSARVLADQEPVLDEELVLESPAGERTHFRVNAAPLFDADGDVERVVLAGENITELKEHEREIEQRKETLETELSEIFDRVSDAFYALDDEWRFTHVNDRAAELMNRSPDGLVGRTIWEVYPDAREDVYGEQFRTAMETQEPVTFEVYADGPGAWLEINAYPSESGLSVYFRDVTERKARERSLERTERRFEAVFEDPNILVGLLDPDGTVLDINGTAMEYIDADLEAVRGDLFWETPWWGEGDEITDDVREWTERAAAGEYVEFEADLTDPDGQQYTIAGAFRPVTNDAGDVVSVIVSDRDVTERKERERELRESERRYRTLAEYFPNGLVTLFDHDLTYTLAAGKGFDRLPVDPEDVEGKQFSEAWDEGIAEALEPLFQGALDGEERSVEVEYAGRDWIVRGVPITDERGEVFAGMTMAQDVTEQVEREAELERALDLLEKTERIADVGGWEIDTETRDVFWTDHIFELLEVHADEEPPLEEALDMYHEDDQPVVEDAIDVAMATGDPFDVEVRLRTAASDEVRWLRLQGAPETVDGDIVSLRGAAQDVTDRKRREQRLEELVERLEESNERLEQFAYAASHDLQEPLRMVSSYLKLIEQRYADELDEDGEEFIEFAVDGADRMRDMIEGLLEYSRVDTRGDPFEPVDLDSVLSGVLENLQVRIEESGADIVAEDLPTVEGDSGQLRQVFQNLIDNAIEYSGEDPPRVTISADRDGDWWEISVTDQGIGIDAADQERVFEVFQSLHARDEHSGTGIGLALCERIVERHGGEIWVDSDPGDGTTFTFTLPAASEGDE